MQIQFINILFTAVTYAHQKLKLSAANYLKICRHGSKYSLENSNHSALCQSNLWKVPFSKDSIQPTFTCSKSTMETAGQFMKSVLR